MLNFRFEIQAQVQHKCKRLVLCCVVQGSSLKLTHKEGFPGLIFTLNSNPVLKLMLWNLKVVIIAENVSF